MGNILSALSDLSQVAPIIFTMYNTYCPFSVLKNHLVVWLQYIKSQASKVDADQVNEKKKHISGLCLIICFRSAPTTIEARISA